MSCHIKAFFGSICVLIALALLGLAAFWWAGFCDSRFGAKGILVFVSPFGLAALAMIYTGIYKACRATCGGAQ